MNHLEHLNPAQQEAVTHTTGPLMIIAGAGTGKTRVITHRILNLIQNGVAPYHILALTFTNKAASEMKHRVVDMLQKDRFHDEGAPFIGTFHALGVAILRENASVFGLSKYFTIFDRDDSLSVIKHVMKELAIDTKRYAPSMMLSLISRNKGGAVPLALFRTEYVRDYFSELLGQVWEQYEQELTKEKALDFDDLLLVTVEKLKAHPAILAEYHRRFTHIHVDEYQDTNIVQYELIKLLAGTNNNVCVVGDHDQQIYSWRGASMKNLVQFEKDFQNTKTITLEENYRSTQTILDAANQAIVHNRHRKEKKLFTSGTPGEKIELFSGFNEHDEARWIAERTVELLDAGVLAHSIAVLFRANFQSRVLEEAFLSHTIPYQVLGTRFFERKEVKDIISYLFCAFNPESAVHLSRAINVPPRGIGKVSLLKILHGETSTLPLRLQATVASFTNLLERIRTYALTHTVAESIKYTIVESGIEKMLKEGSNDDHERLLNVQELVTIAKERYDGMTGEEGILVFLEHALLASDQDSLKKDERSVKLMTIHASKGLEFDHVFIAGLEEGLLPHEGSVSRETPEEREEERRLFYVALTRARVQAHLSYAHTRTLYGSSTFSMPSRFITDIDEGLVSRVDEPHNEWTGEREFLIID